MENVSEGRPGSVSGSVSEPFSVTESFSGSLMTGGSNAVNSSLFTLFASSGWTGVED